MDEEIYEDIEMYEESFSFFDKDGDGMISSEEFKLILNSLGLNPTQSELTDLINEIDTNKDGKIDFTEFRTKLSFINKTLSKDDQFLQAFRMFDKDGNGYISSSELRNVMLSLGEKLSDEELDDMIASADIDGDGQVNYEEFVKIIFEK